MDNTVSEPPGLDSQRLDECEDFEFLRNVAGKLWDIIDEIDTTSDIAKENDEWYRKRVEHLQKRRWETGITTDGYNLFRV